MKKLSYYVFDYLRGDLNENIARRIENNEKIMLAIITNNKDFDYYDRASDRLKLKYSFVSKLIDVLTPEEVNLMVSYYFDNSHEKNINHMQLLCLVDELYEKTESEFLEDHAARAEIFYQSAMENIAKEVLKHTGEVIESRDEFAVILNTFGDQSPITNFFARRRLDEIFLYGRYGSYEEFVHAHFSRKEQVLEKGFNNFQMDIIGEVDTALEEYTFGHLELFERYKKFNEYIVDNWDDYIDSLNREKVQDMDKEIADYMDDNNLDDYFFEFIPFIYSKTPYMDIYNKYEDSPQTEIREPKSFVEIRFCEEFIDRVYERFTNDTFFGEEYYDNDQKCEIINIAKARRKR